MIDLLAHPTALNDLSLEYASLETLDEVEAQLADAPIGELFVWLILLQVKRVHLLGL